jgi:hypothetical protein
MLDHPLVTFVGEIGDADKNDFIGNAKALLTPIDWPEPFGLVIIEAMACGTAGNRLWPRRDSRTDRRRRNRLHRAQPGAGHRGGALDRPIDRRTCRATFERRYTTRVMAGPVPGALPRAGEERMAA